MKAKFLPLVVFADTVLVLSLLFGKTKQACYKSLINKFHTILLPGKGTDSDDASQFRVEITIYPVK